MNTERGGIILNTTASLPQRQEDPLIGSHISHLLNPVLGGQLTSGAAAPVAAPAGAAAPVAAVPDDVAALCWSSNLIIENAAITIGFISAVKLLQN